jgi:putative flippase GtrA
MSRQLAAFVLVGCVAAGTHMIVVALLVEALHFRILAANVIGFSVAFFVSFGGHSRLTFPTRAEGRAAARKRFFIIALTGFAVNQSAYASGLDAMGERGGTLYLPLLFLVLAGVAGFTFTMSKFWVFAFPETRAQDGAAPGAHEERVFQSRIS